MYSCRLIQAVFWATLVVGFVLPSGPARAFLFDPTFTVGFGTNTTNAPFDLAESATTPLSRSADVVTNSVFGPPAKQVTVIANADRGQIKTLNKITNFGFFSPNRSEVTARFRAGVGICGAGSVMTCVNPNLSGPIPIPYPNINRTTNFTFDNASGFSRVTAKINGTTVGSSELSRSDGDEPGSLKDIISGRVLGPGGRRVTGLSVPPIVNAPVLFVLEVSTESLVSCAISCSGIIDETQTVSFVENEPAFLGLPDGLTIFAPDLNIFNNRWTPPGSSSPPDQLAVPEPATLPLLLTGLLILGLAARRRR